MFTPIPAQAEDGATLGALFVTGQDDVYFHTGEHVFRFDRALNLKSRAILVNDPTVNLPTYRNILGPSNLGR